jgi:hypothetical protein
MPKGLFPPTILSALVCAANVIPAEAADWFELSRDNAWLQNYDPTLVSRRAYSEFSYEEQNAGRSIYKLDSSVRGAHALVENLALGYQIELPYKWRDTGTGNISGFGDVECRTGVIGRISDTLRWGTGLNMEFDTAEHPELGSNAFLLRPTTAISWGATDSLNLGITAKYTFTPTAEGPHDASVLKFEIPVSVRISEQWSASATYKPQWNFLNDSSSQRLEFDANYVWGKHHQFALLAGIEVPLTSQTLQFKSLLGLTWHF